MRGWLPATVTCLLGAGVCAGQAPSESTVLFDGELGDRWVRQDGGPVGWSVEGDVLRVVPGSGSIMTTDPHADVFLHVEFRLPESVPGATGQARANSGVYLQRRYEIQILDSFGEEAAFNGCGAIYRRKAPDANASRPAGEWQRYDIDFRAARFDEGAKVENARVTVRHNGVLIHDDVEVEGKTGAGLAEGPEPMALLLQDHGSPIEFRNIWMLDRSEGWTKLIGDSLDGWVKRGGEATYALVDGVIVGETRPHQPNTFLCTARDYADFLLSYECMVDDELNSGVQIRSLSSPDEQDGRVHGYQVEMDPSNRSWTAGIYDEARRGWLDDLADNEPAREAFRHGEWNHILVEAKGDRIRTWINGVPAADLRDDMTASGFIGLQVHGVGGREDPLQVRWRNIEILELDEGK